MINKVILVGRLTKDPMMRMSANGLAIASFTLACNRRVQANSQQQADFISCVAFGKTAELIEKYVFKGSLVGIEGRINTNSYDDASGKRVYTTNVAVENIQFLESRSSSVNNQNQRSSLGNNDFGFNGVEEDEFDTDGIDISSEDLPF